jgi:transposase
LPGRLRCTLEFKQEAVRLQEVVRLVESGQSLAAVARSLGVVEQTLGNWVREHRAGTLKGASCKPQVTAEQMEVSRLRAKLARVTMERDIRGKVAAYFAKGQR